MRFEKEGPERIQIRYLDILGILFCYTIAWAFYGLGCWMVSKSLALTGHLMTFLGIFPFAWVIGYLSFITTSGLGVREQATVVLLTGLMGSASASVMTIMVWILWTVAETLCFLVTKFIKVK